MGRRSALAGAQCQSASGLFTRRPCVPLEVRALFFIERQMSFQDLGLRSELLRAIELRGYAKATPIQLQAIPTALEGRDILGCAQTGTGKTAAFALPILQRLVAENQANQPAPRATESDSGSERQRRPARPVRPIRTLILVPTRELAVQVAGSFAAYGKGLGLRQTTIFGGVSARPQIEDLRRGVDIIVATPGRFLDLWSQGLVRLDQVKILVLDEADQLFDMGFIRDVRKIIRSLPKERQTMLFSATLPEQIRALARECLSNPVSISATPQGVTPDKIDQQVRYLRAEDKPDALIDFLQEHSGQRTLVFCRTKHGADKIVRKLQGADIDAVAIHGNKSQNARQAALRAFNEPQPPILVATDVAARGLHMPDIKIVVNYELSDTPETYIHRIGRTARAEAEGRAVTFCAPDERSLMQRIEYLTKVRLRVLANPNGSEAAETFEREPRTSDAAPSRRYGERPARKSAYGSKRFGAPRSGARSFGKSSFGRSRRPGGGQRSAKPRRFAAG